jgi:transcriptional regulator with XRE-family HTH domain
MLPGNFSTMTDRTSIKADFADRLKAAIERKGWTMSQTARRTSAYLDESEKFGRAHVWHYVQGRSLPKSRYLEAMSRALDVEPSELLPGEAGEAIQARPAGESAAAEAPVSLQKESVLHVRDYGDGTALLEISERVPWATAIAVLQLLKNGPGE